MATVTDSAMKSTHSAELANKASNSKTATSYKLPPELLRPIIKHVLLTSKLKVAVGLRRVNRLFDAEVLTVIENENILWDDQWLSDDENGTRFSSEFMATYLLRRPHKQSPWNANVSSLLNTLVDDIMHAKGLSIEHPSRRGYMKRLCQSVRQEKFHSVLVPCLYPRQFHRHAGDTIDEGFPYDDYLFLANIILGEFTLDSADSKQLIDNKLSFHSFVLGTVFKAAIWGRQYDLMRYIMDKCQAGDDASMSTPRFCHFSLEPAILNGDLTAVKMIMEPQEWGGRGRIFLKRNIDMANSLKQTHIAEYMEAVDW